MRRKLIKGSYYSARLGSNRLFWRTRYQIGKLNFISQRRGFHLKDGVKKARSEPRYWRAMSRGTVMPIIIAITLSFLLYIAERNLVHITDISWLNDNFIGKYLLLPLDNETYVQMLTVIAGVTGVFLGLYFTAVSTVISNAYSSVSGDVRELVLGDKLGNNYVKLVSFLTAFSLILLAFSSTGTPPFHLAIPILAIVSCLAIFAFVKLGRRTFFLSDPTLFFDTLSGELIKWVNQATYRGHQWRSPHFQNFYQTQALRSATTLATLAKISSEKPELQGESHPKLIRKLLALVSAYYSYKRLIPSESRWYLKKYQHKQWYLTDSTELEMATQTDTTLQPNEIPDTSWLEDLITEEVLKAFRADLETGDYKSLYNKTVNLPEYFKSIGNNWHVEDGIKFHTKISKHLLKALTSEQKIDEAQEQYALAVMDIVATSPLSIELGFVNAIKELDLDKLKTELRSTNWSKYDAPYHFDLPIRTIKVIEEVASGIRFERKAHGQRQTASWYIVELVLHDLELALYEQWQSFFETLETWYRNSGKKLADTKQYKLSATLYSRAIEQAWKLDSHIEQLRELTSLLHKDTRVDFIQKAEWDWDKEHERVAKFRNMAIKGQAELIPHLWDTTRPDPNMPDFFGGAVHRTGEACFDALVNGDSGEFKALFRPYFLGILGIFESVKPQVKGWETSSAIAWMSEPILDLFDISGYAYIFAEYHDKPELWDECKAVWDTYLKTSEQQLQSLSVISSYNQTPRGVITPRATLRSRWQLHLARLLNSLPRQGTSDFYSQPRVQHKSKFIQNISPWSDDMPFMHTDAIDVFSIKYLLNLQVGKDLDFGVSDDKIRHVNKNLGEQNE